MDETPSNGGGRMGKNVFHLTADMLPPGYAEKLKAGDTIQLQVVSPMDGDKDIAVECVHDEKEMPHDEGMEQEGKEGDWESDFRASMSPQAEEQQPG